MISLYLRYHNVDALWFKYVLQRRHVTVFETRLFLCLNISIHNKVRAAQYILYSFCASTVYGHACFHTDKVYLDSNTCWKHTQTYLMAMVLCWPLFQLQMPILWCFPYQETLLMSRKVAPLHSNIFWFVVISPHLLKLVWPHRRKNTRHWSSSKFLLSWRTECAPENVKQLYQIQTRCFQGLQIFWTLTRHGMCTKHTEKHI